MSGVKGVSVQSMQKVPISLSYKINGLKSYTIYLLGRVSDVHLPMLHAMLMPSAEGERHNTHACAYPRCHTDLVRTSGKPKVHI